VSAGIGAPERLQRYAAAGFKRIAAFALLFVGWELGVRLSGISQIVLPAPSDIWLSFVQSQETILANTWITLQEIVLGFLAGGLFGSLVAIGIFYVPYLRRSLYPLLVGLHTVPKIAFAPLIVLWFGSGIESKLFLTLLLVFFPVLVNVFSGLKETEESKVMLARSYDVSEWFTFWKVRLPSALPLVFSGLKLGVVFASIGAIVAEFVSASEGVGALLINLTQYGRTAEAIAAVAVVVLMTLVLYGIVAYVERRVLFWRLAT
jgi:NitT/TauT family transport system permease protein